MAGFRSWWFFLMAALAATASVSKTADASISESLL
jgi:hypothetical protein